VSELYAPVTGKVVEVNGELEDAPELVNSSPYEQAWMIAVELSDEAELDKLMDADKYEAMVKE
ncbi:glycine cleavage system protein H, partial [Mesorhizobium sp. M00.F.Ca.ET.186.01.1.1]